MAGVLCVAALLIDRLGQRAGSLRARAQPLLTDLAERPDQRILPGLDRVEQDPCERRKLAALVPLASGLIPSVPDRDLCPAFDVLHRGAVALDSSSPRSTNVCEMNTSSSG